MFYLSDAFIDNLLTEDIPLNDCTTESLGISKEPGRLRCYPKKDGIVSGVEIAACLLEKAGMKVFLQAEEGEFRKTREVVLEATGKADSLQNRSKCDGILIWHFGPCTSDGRCRKKS